MTRDRYIAGLLLLLLGIIYLARVNQYDFISDDSFITLRYARNLVEGNGLVFNPGERVEGFTSLLWTLLLAGVHWAGFDLLHSARVLGVLFGFLAMVLSYRLTTLSSDQPIPPLVAAFAPLVLSLNGSFACWAASGMETMLFVSLIVACFLAAYSNRFRLSVLLTVALILARPEGLIVFLILGVFQFVQHGKDEPRRTMIWFAVCIGAIAALFIFRHQYFGYWFPNTFYAKTGGGLDAVKRGLAYLSEYAFDHEGLALMAVPVVYGLIAGNIRQRFLALGVLALWASTIWVGGDGLPMYRFALSPLPLLLVLQALILADLYRFVTRRSENRRNLYITGTVAVLLLLVVHVTRPMLQSHYNLYAYQKQIEIPRWTAVGKWFRKNAQDGESIATVPVGAVSYYSRLKVLDMLGLTDKHIAHRKMPSMGTGWAGHEKYDGQYVLSQKPTYLLLGNIDVTKEPRDPEKKQFIPYRKRAVWQREKDLYETDLISTLYEPRSVEIAPEQYLNFYALRGEFRSDSNTERVQ